jgi:hypothetical protein
VAVVSVYELAIHILRRSQHLSPGYGCDERVQFRQGNKFASCALQPKPWRSGIDVKLMSNAICCGPPSTVSARFFSRY